MSVDVVLSSSSSPPSPPPPSFHPPPLPSIKHINNSRPIAVPRKQYAVHYKTDIQTAIDVLREKVVLASDKNNLQIGHLGEVLERMGAQGQLFPQLKDENFDIVDKRQLTPATVEYLNYLEIDKLFQCRWCYTTANWLWCNFHKIHAYRGSRSLNNQKYIEFLNSDMGVVSFIEEYYFYLSSCTYKHEAKHILKTLTGFENLAELMESYNFSSDKCIDVNAYELMDFEY